MVQAVEECKEVVHISLLADSAVRAPSPMGMVDPLTGIEIVDPLTGVQTVEKPLPGFETMEPLTGLENVEPLTGFESVEPLTGFETGPSKLPRSLYAGKRWESLANEVSRKFGRGIRGVGIKGDGHHGYLC